MQTRHKKEKKKIVYFSLLKLVNYRKFRNRPSLKNGILVAWKSRFSVMNWATWNEYEWMRKESHRLDTFWNDARGLWFRAKKVWLKWTIHTCTERKFTKAIRWLILWWWLQARIASQTLPKQERKRTLRLLNLERLVVIQFLFKFSYDFLLLFGIWPVQSCSSVHTRCSRWFADQLLAMVESSGEYNKPIKHHDHRFSDCPTHTDPVPNGS